MNIPDQEPIPYNERGSHHEFITLRRESEVDPEFWPNPDFLNHMSQFKKGGLYEAGVRLTVGEAKKIPKGFWAVIVDPWVVVRP